MKLLLVLLFVAVFYGAGPQVKKEDKKSRAQLSDEAKKKIANTLAIQKDNSVSLFDIEGNFKKVIRELTRADLEGYGSLEDLVVKGNPIDGCKNPVPSPPCIICDDGRVVCSYAKFIGKTRKKEPNGLPPAARTPPP